MDKPDGDLSSLEDVVVSIQDLPDNSAKVTIADIQDHIGRRSFGPLLLVIGLIVLTPIGGIPGVPTLFGVITLLISGQLLLGSEHFWLPKVITRRSVKGEHLCRAMDKVRPFARWVDRILKPRLVVLTTGAASYVVAACCVALGLLLPALELVPMAAAVPALAIAAFGLSLVANDGLFALLGYATVIVSIWLPATLLLF